jgi:hypothetical protein
MTMADLKKKWVTTKEAAAILTERSGHTVSEDYVRRLGNTGRLRTEQIDERTKLYWRSDVEKYTVRKRGDGRVRAALRKPRGLREEAASQEETQEQRPAA